MDKIAIVTGGNRGLGFEACRQLAKIGVRVVLTCRDVEKGKKAAAILKQEGLLVDIEQCDVTDPHSIEKLAERVKKKYHHCDIVVNNAGILIEKNSHSSLLDSTENVQKALQVNFYGPLQMCKALIPLMKKSGYGRVVNVSSGLGQLSEMGSGYPSYRISKVAINAITRILASEFEGTGIKVNSVCPGWVKTDMGGPNAERDPEKGVETIIWLATLPENGPSGGFFRDKKEIPW